MKALPILVAALIMLIVGCGSDKPVSSEISTVVLPRDNPNITSVLDRPNSEVLTPDFTLPSADGKTVGLSNYLGKQPVVVVFYRGFF